MVNWSKALIDVRREAPSSSLTALTRDMSSSSSSSSARCLSSETGEPRLLGPWKVPRLPYAPSKPLGRSRVVVVIGPTVLLYRSRGWSDLC